LKSFPRGVFRVSGVWGVLTSADKLGFSEARVYSFIFIIGYTYYFA